jgi:drug/metabolite transporter, DME family
VVPLGASLVALGSGLVWSFGAVNARLADRSDAFQYLVWRSVGVLVVVEIITSIRRRPSATMRMFAGGAVMIGAAFFLFMSSVAFIYAIKNTTPANAAFLFSLTPLIATVFAVGVLGERLGPVTVGALALALIGLMVTVAGDIEAGNMAGNIAAVLAAAGFAGYTVCVRSDSRRDWSPVMSGYAALTIVVCAVVTLVGGRTLVPPAGDIALGLVHGGVFIVGGTLMFNWASKRIATVAMTVFAQSETVFVPLWAFIVLGLAPPTPSIIGGAIIFAT